MKRVYKISSIILVTLLVLFGNLSVIGFAGGTGTESDPYIITTAEELQNINNNLSAYYVLGNNIDLNEADFTPIGNGISGTFTGSFDGNGYTISNLNVFAGKYAGLFGCNEGVIKNVTLSEIYVYGTRHIGGIVGENTEAGTIIDCSVLSGEVETDSAVYEINIGGIAGKNSGSLSGCFSNGASVSVYDSPEVSVYAGGVAGFNNKALNITAYNTADIYVEGTYNSNYNNYAGGFLGFSKANLTFLNSYNKGDIEITSAYYGSCGGFVANCSDYSVNISGSYNAGDVSGLWSAGGLVGYGDFIIDSSYNCGNITASTGSYGYAGGLVASGDGTITRSYNTGNIDASYSAGIACSMSGTISQCYNSGFVADSSISAGFVCEGYGVAIENSYNTGFIDGSYSSAFIGQIYGTQSTIFNCYNIGFINGRNGSGVFYAKKYDSGNPEPKITNSYALDGSVISNYRSGIVLLGDSVESLTEAESKYHSCWDFEDIWQTDENVNNGFPVLKNITQSSVISNYSSLVLKLGESLQLKAYKDGAELSDVTWYLSAGNCSISTSGYACFNNIGFSQVSAVDSSGNKAVFNFYVVEGAQNITIDDMIINITSSYSSPTISFSGSDIITSYESSNEDVFTIDLRGCITPVSVGTATLTVNLASGASSTCNVTITAEALNLYLSTTSFTMLTGEEYQLSVTTNPSESTSTITFTSSNEAVATVDNTGKVTAIDGGIAVIEAATDNGIKQICTVTVKKRLESMSFAEPDIKMYVNDTVTLKLNASPVDFTEDITYTCSSYYIAVSSNGVVTSYSSTGTYIITATSESGLTAYCTVTVEEWPEVLTIADTSEATLSKYYLTTPEVQTGTLDECIAAADGFEYIATASLRTETAEIYGTGSTVAVYNNCNQEVITYFVVVQGDVNGDSVCDVIDCAQVARNSTENNELSGAYLKAADYDYDETVTVNDYQQVVNQALTI